jgi:transposase
MLNRDMSKDKLPTTDWRERRRFQALDLKRNSWRQESIATSIGVTKGAVSQWMRVARTQGEDALRARPHSGRPAELTPAEKQLIPELLAYGAEAYGFRGEVWTCSRVRKVIEWGLGVSYHKSHVARVLKALHWTPQMPVQRAAQRDEAAITLWRTEVWAALKKRHAWSAGS